MLNSESINKKEDDETPNNNLNEDTYEQLTEQAKFAEKARKEIAYTGIFVDREALYEAFPASLEKSIANPHITINYMPDANQLHLEELGTEAKIYVIGYGNDGNNEGLLVRTETDNPILQNAIDSIRVQHITLSCSKNGKPKDTADIPYDLFDSPVELKINNSYGCFIKADKAAGRDSFVATDLDDIKSAVEE